MIGISDRRVSRIMTIYGTRKVGDSERKDDIHGFSVVRAYLTIKIQCFPQLCWQSTNEIRVSGYPFHAFMVTDTNSKTKLLPQPPSKLHRHNGNIFHGAQGRAHIPTAWIRFDFRYGHLLSGNLKAGARFHVRKCSDTHLRRRRRVRH